MLLTGAFEPLDRARARKRRLRRRAGQAVRAADGDQPRQGTARGTAVRRAAGRAVNATAAAERATASSTARPRSGAGPAADRRRRRRPRSRTTSIGSMRRVRHHGAAPTGEGVSRRRNGASAIRGIGDCPARRVPGRSRRGRPMTAARIMRRSPLAARSASRPSAGTPPPPSPLLAAKSRAAGGTGSIALRERLRPCHRGHRRPRPRADGRRRRCAAGGRPSPNGWCARRSTDQAQSCHPGVRTRDRGPLIR